MWTIDPWGDYRDDIRNGILCQTIISPHLKKGAKPPPIESFMVFEEPEVRTGQTEDDIRACLQGMTKKR